MTAHVAKVTVRTLLLAAGVVAATVAHGASAMSSEVRDNLLRLARCETGGKPGRNGRPDWQHRSRDYSGGLGFYHQTWRAFAPPGYPAEAWQATIAQQLAVGAILVRTYDGYSSWPACSRRLGLR